MGMVATLIVFAVVIGFAVRFLYFSNFNKIAEWGEPRPMPAATADPAAAAPPATPTETTTPTPTQWPTPIILEQTIVKEIQVEVTREVSVYRDVIVEVEVTREVQVVNVVPTPTVTPTPRLAPGAVRVCAWVEGAQALYIGQIGVVSGGCQIFTFGVGQTMIPVQVNK